MAGLRGEAMAIKIFINYRRDDSIGMAGRLHDRLAQTFGRDNLFMDVDHIPVGADFVTHLNNQVAACDILLVVIGPSWLSAKDDSGARRLDNPEDFVAIEIAAALTRDIRVIPVLVDGARMPKAAELPDTLKPLVRRQAAEMRHTHFGRDAEALIERVREALGDKAGLARWRGRALAGVAAIAVLLLIGAGGYVFLGHLVEHGVQQAELKLEGERKAAEAEANRKAMDAAAKAEQDRQAKAAQEAEAKRQADQAEQQRLAAIKAEQDRQAKAAQEAEAKRKADQAEQQQVDAQNAFNSGVGYFQKGDYDRAIANFSDAIRLSLYYSTNPIAYLNRGLAYSSKGDYTGALVDYNQAIRLDPKNPVVFFSRGTVYGKKGDLDDAIVDFNQAIQLNPNYAPAFVNRGAAYNNKSDYDRGIADFTEAIRLDSKNAFAFHNRAFAYINKGDNDRAIDDYSEAIRLNPNDAMAFYYRGLANDRKGYFDRAIADYSEAIRLEPTKAFIFCNRGIAKSKINDPSANADIAKARQLDPSVCRTDGSHSQPPDAQRTCEATATAANLSGMAKASFIKKCVTDAGGN
jgi:tetratricopeptide (TPR) repeat protein